MTREQALSYRKVIEQGVVSLSDEVALETPTLFPLWRAGIVYSVGMRICHAGTLYKCLQAHESQVGWEPGIAHSLWTKVLISDSTVIPEWEQPDSTNPYAAGDKVTHNGKTWVSTADNNVWEPGVYGWEEIKTE